MEKKLSKTYNTAYEELSKEWNTFMDKQEPKVKEAYQELQEALKTGDTQTIFDAKIKYQRVLMNTTIQNNRYQSMVDDLTDKMTHVNEIALDYVNDNMPYVYTVNYNQFSRENIKGYSFSMVSENAVKELMVTDQMLVPTKKLDIPKDKAWNTKFINSQVTQGILQGESIDKIAKRILPEIANKSESNLVSRNKNSAIRNARTMTTAAENKGRQDSFKKAQSDGVIMTRSWVATFDERTRAWHADLNGVETGIDEPWENDYGEIMFPGDPTAHPANVYNCRCSIRAHVKGFDWSKSENIIPDNPLNIDEEREIKSYKSFDFYTINEKLRDSGLKYLTSLEKTKVKNLDSALSKLPTYSGNVSRSLYFSNREDLNDYINDIKDKKKLVSKAYTSTTKNDEFYNPDAQVQIIIENSSSGKDLRGYDNGENEVLFERDFPFNIKRQGWFNDVYVIILEEYKKRRKK